MFYLCEGIEYMFGVATEARNMGSPWPSTTDPFSATTRLENAAASYTA
jgi:hypothetical protein